jgi:hypothetical protein
MSNLPARPEQASGVRPADRLRLRHYLERLSLGDEPTAACWATLTHPDFGMRKFIERADKPLGRKTLLQRIDRLFKLGAPEMVVAAADAARAVLAQNAAATTETVLDIARGRFEKTRDGAASARVQREAACWALECLGIAPPRGGGVSVQTTVAVKADAGAAQEMAAGILAALKAGRPSPFKYTRVEDEAALADPLVAQALARRTPHPEGIPPAGLTESAAADEAQS